MVPPAWPGRAEAPPGFKPRDTPKARPLIKSASGSMNIKPIRFVVVDAFLDTSDLAPLQRGHTEPLCTTAATYP
jgi:hypothetical protein